jgi:hypothetical protein
VAATAPTAAAREEANEEAASVEEE